MLRGTVLLVDGDPASLAALSHALLGSDYRVIRATGPASALAVLGRGPVDVILTALELAGMNGLELLGWARALRPEAVRVVLAGHPDVASAISAINREEVFRYLTKPVSRDQLLATVQLALEHRWRAQALRVDAPAPRPARGRPSVRVQLEPAELDALREACRTFLQPGPQPALAAWMGPEPEPAAT